MEMKLSLVIPAHNEEGCIEETVRKLSSALTTKGIPHELLVVNDNSQDRTETILMRLQKEITALRYVNNLPPNGFGLAVRKGLDNFDGDIVAIVMADGSDLPEDVVAFYETIQKGYDCVFGSRFMGDAKVINYPKFKLILNRVVNFAIRVMFRLHYNDITNAFKMYRASVIPGLKPFLSHHFNLTVELPLKAIIRGYHYTIVPNSWLNRCSGESKLKIKEMGSRYLFIILYCFIEKWLSRGDYLVNNKNTCIDHTVSAGGNQS
jgi:dolichol-phosphate mannosyltransferase